MLTGVPSLKTLFLDAAAIGDPEVRAAFLNERCGSDSVLLARVKSLLSANDQALAAEGTASFANDGPTECVTVDFAGKDEQPGAMIAGKYKLIEEIGEGGMGIVFMAQQTEPVRRAVAVKVIRAGMDSKAVLARFEAERQALAMMDHPNIARVLDAGTTDSGRPFFVMELVKGTPITQHCDEHKLTLRQRLELFIPVCQAIQHAHQKGIIHRDIKPSNVLVALYDDHAVPKVIDFGIAKATGQSLTDMTLMTGFGAVVGTPEYMSPEQASLNNLDVDTRSDVYSLGVLLYELLTGSTPVDRKSLGKAALLEVLRIVREVETPKPSAKLSTIATLANVASNRGTEPARLSKLMKGELDWLVLKSLEKDRTRRYETANGLARDIQRYLADEIVEARPPSTGYRLRKFVRRHKGQVLAASLLLLVLLAGIAGTTLGLFEAQRQEQLAVAASERETVRANAEAKERERADLEKQRAIRFRDQALDALRATTNVDVEKLIGSKQELNTNEREYLEAIAQRWLVFAKQAETDGDVRDLPAEGRTYVAALWRRLGRYDEARKEYELARDLQLKLVAQYPEVPGYRKRLGAIRNNLAVMQAMLGDREQAWAELMGARELRESLVQQYPSEASYQKELGQTLLNIGLQLAEVGKNREALREFEAARALYLKVCASTPDNIDYQQELGIAESNLGTLSVTLKHWDVAQKSLRASCDIRRKLADRFPEVSDYRMQLAQSYFGLGHMCNSQGQQENACREFVIARDLQQKLAEQFPAVPHYQRELALTANALGSAFHALGKLDEACRQHQLALNIRKSLAAQHPAIPQYQIDLGASYCNTGLLLSSEEKWIEGLEFYTRAIATLQRVHEKEPAEVHAKQFLRNSHLNRALAYCRLRRFAESGEDWDRVVALSPPGEHAAVRYQQQLTRLRSIPVLDSVKEINELAKSGAWNGEQWSDFACICAVATGRFEDRKAEFGDRAMQLLHKAVAAGFKDLDQLKNDPELASLRERKDFQTLMAELEQRLNNKASSLPPGKK
ncbi:hypothetical protein BH11PLA2_BH11PLA2_24070 [soil metagenome]